MFRKHSALTVPGERPIQGRHRQASSLRSGCHREASFVHRMRGCLLVSICDLWPHSRLIPIDARRRKATDHLTSGVGILEDREPLSCEKSFRKCFMSLRPKARSISGLSDGPLEMRNKVGYLRLDRYHLSSLNLPRFEVRFSFFCSRFAQSKSHSSTRQHFFTSAAYRVAAWLTAAGRSSLRPQQPSSI